MSTNGGAVLDAQSISKVFGGLVEDSVIKESLTTIPRWIVQDPKLAPKTAKHR